ncbi:hypothetical protein CEXT_523621 [Caerostris extrusa]|uniref:Uncharacterized protein n=1 Tax=Caerostris extrusa TaxID=172846 RepID=A0AAV4RB37_CAEEX|nr:hypothetical protein CEXT_523621 [Caerostris extrusa]
MQMFFNSQCLSSTDMWVDSYRLLILPLASEAVSRPARDLNMDLWTFSRRNTSFLLFQEGSRDVLIPIQGSSAANEITWGASARMGTADAFFHGRNLPVLQKVD